MIFSIAMGAEYSSYVESIATFAPTFYGHIISVLASVDTYPVRKSKKIIDRLMSQNNLNNYDWNLGTQTERLK